MVERFRASANYLRVSRPGIDVATAAEKDLMISLSARNMQIIQRFYVSAPTPTNVNTGLEQGTFTFNISFPNQQTIPDFWCAIVDNSDQDYSNYSQNSKPTYDITLTTNSAVVKIVGSTNQYVGIKGLRYMVLRKRQNS